MLQLPSQSVEQRTEKTNYRGHSSPDVSHGWASQLHSFKKVWYLLLNINEYAMQQTASYILALIC